MNNNTFIPRLRNRRQSGVDEKYGSQSVSFVDGVNTIKVPFNTAHCRGGTLQAPVLMTPGILMGAQAAAWALGAFTAGFHVGYAIGRGGGR